MKFGNCASRRAPPGDVRRSLASGEIQRRTSLAMVNEAALLLAEGVASRPSDVDVVLVQGYGFARWEGGPVLARGRDRDRLQADLRTVALKVGIVTDPAPRLHD